MGRANLFLFIFLPLSLKIVLAENLSLPHSSQAVAANSFSNYSLSYTSQVDAALQGKLEAIDSRLRELYGMTTNQTAVGLLDVRTPRLAMIRPDHEEYGASVPKIGILLAYFQLHPEAATNLEPSIRHDLGLMIKISSNEKAAQFSRQLGLKQIQQVLDDYHLYDASHGGGIWVGKHYGQGGERFGDPIADNSHAATVRQLLRYYLLLEQGKLVSPAASNTMREIFASPDIPHDENKFVKGLAGRPLQILRKSGTWEDWYHDTAIITGPNRHYILVALTHHPKGDDYLVSLAPRIDDLIVADIK
jgi:beta-lactamase class A